MEVVCSYTDEPSETIRYLGVACTIYHPSQYSVPSSTVATPYLAFIGLVLSLILSPISPIMLKFQNLYFFLLYCQITPQSRAWVHCGNLLCGSGHPVPLASTTHLALMKHTAAPSTGFWDMKKKIRAPSSLGKVIWFKCDMSRATQGSSGIVEWW